MYKYLFLLLCSVLVMSSCRYRHGKRVSGNGKEVTAQRNLTGFTGVATRGDIDVVATQGAFNVRVAAEENLMEYIETTVENGHLVVRFRDGISLMDHHDAKVYVTAPELNVFEVHGSANITSQGTIADKNKINIVISGSGDIELTLDCPEVNTSTGGSGNITLKGETKNITCKTSGSGDLIAASLKAENVKVSVHGSGNAEVFASESLEIDISGSGDVRYKGTPKINTTVHGSGTVSKMD